MRDISRITTAAALLLVSSTMAATAKGIDRERLNPVLTSLAKVEAVTESGSYSLGTAVSVAPGKFVTSCHVTARSAQVVLIYEGLRWPVVSQSSDTEHDACLLDVPSLEHVAPVKLGRSLTTKPGQDVVAMGYTFGAGLLAQSGTISALHWLDGAYVIQSSTPFNSGASGGGLFDEDGTLIGILTFRLPGADGFYFSIPVDWILDRIDKADTYTKIAPLDGPRPFWARPKESLPYFMKATSLEAIGDWEGLVKLTEEWTVSDQSNAEPWIVRGQAYMHLDRIDAAIKAFRMATQREPHLPLAWQSLGEASARRGNHEELLDALNHLRPLDAELADDLAARSDTTAQH